MDAINRFRTVDQGLWSSLTYGVDVEPPETLKALFAYWCEKRGSAFAPRSDTFDLRDLGDGVVDGSVIVAVTRSPLTFTYTHWGAERTRLFGDDYNGRGVREVRPESIARKAREEYVSVVAKRQPAFAETRLELPDGTSTAYHALRLPLTDNGTTVDKIITLYTVPERQDLVRDYYSLARKKSA